MCDSGDKGEPIDLKTEKMDKISLKFNSNEQIDFDTKNNKWIPYIVGNGSVNPNLKKSKTVHNKDDIVKLQDEIEEKNKKISDLQTKIAGVEKKKSTKNFQKRKKNKSAPPKKLKNKNKEKNYILNIEKVNKILNIDNYNSSIKQLNNHNDISLKTSKRNFNNHKPTINTKNIGKFNINRKFRKSKTQKPKSIIERKNKKSTKDKQLHYSNRELNSLVYEEALKYDQRSYFQYYISLLLQKHLMLFTFYPSGDYNLYTLKFILFLLSFSLYFSINGLFFSDNTMHKIYQDKGAFNILFQIPQILYSSIISAIINIILKQLSLSDKNIIKIKNEKDYKTALKKSKTSKDCMYIKFIIFFILSILLMSFFWYFISCFCAVFQNTQIILIKDTCLSFGISMIYPFGLNLLPGFFRIPALRAQKKDKINLYNFSLLVALL